MSAPAGPACQVRRLFNSRSRRVAAVGLLCAVFAVLSVDAMRRESVTIDEPLNLTAGYAFQKFGDYRLADTNGILPQRWFALPLLAMDLRFPDRTAAAWHHPGYVGRDVCWGFLFDSGNNPDAMVFAGRLMALAIGVGIVVAVYGWTRRLFGVVPGILAAVFCVLSPTMLAHGHLMTLDGAAALLFLTCVGSYWLLLRRLTLGRFLASSVCLGLLLVSKMSAPLFIPMALLMTVSRFATGEPWEVGLPGWPCGMLRGAGSRSVAALAVAVGHAVVATAVIWSFLGWHFLPSADWVAGRDSYTEPFPSLMDSLGASRPLIEALRSARLFPETYIYGLAHTIEHVSVRHAYLNGEYSTSGWWWYFPYCFLVKTALPILAAGAVGLAWLVRRARGGSPARLLRWADRTSPFWALLVVYGVAAVLTRLNIGQRHILPVYPVWFGLAGAGTWWLMQRSRLAFGVGLALLALEVGTVVGAHPYYLSYFNALGGGREGGYRHLTDSNVDWGQDLPALAAWLKSDPPLARGGRLYVNCFAYDSPERWGIKAYRLPYDVTNPGLSSADPVAFEPGTYVLSATSLIIPGPPWTEARERQYRAMLARFRELEETIGPRPADEETRRIWADFIFKLATTEYYRLRSRLVDRRPDLMVGGSILVYRLSRADLNRYLVP
jgi:hypothetical protein